jgi:outer membrane protein assembly factor BamB
MSRLKWSFKAEGILGSSPSVGQDGTCYVGCRDRRLYAVDVNGALRWMFTTGGTIEAAPCIHPDGLVVFGSYDGILRAVTPGGTEQWSADLGAPVMTTPCVDDDGNVWVGDDDGRLHSYSIAGQRLARLTISDLLAASPVCIDGHVFVADGRLHGSNGTRVQLAAEPIVASGAAGPDGTFYVGSWDGFVYAVLDGQLLWNAPLDGQIYAACAVGADGGLLAATRAGKVVALAPSGERIWSRKFSDGVYGTPAIAEGGVCFVGCNDNGVYALDMEDGHIVWKERVGRDVRSSVALTDDGTVYVASWDFSLYAFDGGAGGPADAPWPQFQRDAARTGRFTSRTAGSPAAQPPAMPASAPPTTAGDPSSASG